MNNQIPATAKVSVLETPRNMVLKEVAIPQIGDDEILVKVEDVDYVQLNRIYLIEISVLAVAVVSENCRDNVSGVFRTVLIVV